MSRNPQDKKPNLSEKAFEKDVDEALKLLSTTSADWEKRQKLLSKLSDYVVHLQHNPSTVKSIDKLSACYLAQFGDLRSGIIKQIALLINNCSEILGTNFTNTAEKLITSEGLLKYINNANKINSE